jgi:hypothetical protein
MIFLNKPMKVTINVKNSGSDTGDQKKLQQQLENEARDHPLVNAALKIFNGKIVDIKIYTGGAASMKDMNKLMKQAQQLQTKMARTAGGNGAENH